MLVAFAVILGLIFGSFGTVVAYRVPIGQSLLDPKRSHCPNCGHEISALENIPVFSYIFLRGRCRNCKTKISPRYPLTEIVTAILFAAAAAKFDANVETIAYALLFWALVILTVIDLESRKLPDAIVLPLLICGLVFLALAGLSNDYFGEFSFVLVASIAAVVGIAAVMFPWGRKDPEGDPEKEKDKDVDVASPPRPSRTHINPWGVLTLAAWSALTVAAFVRGDQTSLAGAIIGAAIFSGFFFSIALTYDGGMGGGDVKLALVLGAFSGYLGAPGNVLVAMFGSLVVGGLVSIVFLFAGGARKTALPFGPFLALGTIIAIFWGEGIQDWYGGSF
ncbi:MAG TPA: prepilin peptidase [Actinomycetota bacterium]|nr:prepilin peptidase [Actinomycetota bacterium]